MTVADLVSSVLGPDVPVAVRAYDGSRLGPDDAAATLVLRSPDALRRIATSPGELGIGRAYVAGDLDVEGDMYAALELRHRFTKVALTPAQLLEIAKLLGPTALRRLPPPPGEARLRGRRHSPARDAAAIAHHYNVSNEFYAQLLGPSLTYSCAVWKDPNVGLEAAQATKHDLVCRKLGLRPGMRLLDVGCGWGSMLLHAAQHYGVRGVGVTLSDAQAELASKRIADAGLADLIAVRVQDYRAIDDGPFDAISSIGMFEHVGLSRLDEYFSRLFSLLEPGGRLLNHGISRPWRAPHRAHFARRGFIDRFVFPDGELLEVGSVVTAIQRAGFEVRHLESLREHYALTLRAWSANLERDWDAAVAEVGAPRARIWRLYIAASALNFEDGNTQVHQVLAVKGDHGRSGMELRPTF
ncbi:MAG: cyclopropane-fatty-acyl-phospholipid synthase [Actinomycetota bacterium]|nr:cyclopropane-fatty-acyl-phospholipid synthase [Actinomycetota bacterium]